MKLLSYFDSFLVNTVNLNPARMDLLDTRVTAITNFLNADEVFSSLLKTTIPQGSFAQKTIIRPRPDGTFDADVLLHLDPMPEWDAGEYVGKLYTALGRSSVYSDMRHRRTRCVYIDYADEFHVDLIPYVESGGSGYITNRKTGVFELTDPKGFTGWLTGQHRTTGGHLIKTIRLLKYVRDTTWWGDPKSVILTTLLGERVSALRKLLDPGCYADVPTTLKTVVDDLDDYLQSNYFLPAIVDPGGTGDRFDKRWNQDDYARFRTRVHTLREKIDTAHDTQGVDASVTAWQAVFGTGFKAPASTTATKRGALITIPGGKARPASERFLDVDFGIPLALNGATVSMTGRVHANGPLLGYRLPDRANRVDKHRQITFSVEACNVPAPYTIYWKVLNTGHEARAAGNLRGEIRTGSANHTESTLYTGEHWVEVYIVRHNRCVAKSRQSVVIG